MKLLDDYVKQFVKKLESLVTVECTCSKCKKPMKIWEQIKKKTNEFEIKCVCVNCDHRGVFQLRIIKTDKIF